MIREYDPIIILVFLAVGSPPEYRRGKISIVVFRSGVQSMFTYTSRFVMYMSLIHKTTLPTGRFVGEKSIEEEAAFQLLVMYSAPQ